MFENEDAGGLHRLLHSAYAWYVLCMLAGGQV